MNYRMAVLSVVVGIAIGSLCIGQGKPAVKNQAASDAGISDHEKIEKLLSEIAELQKNLAALTHKYDKHTHQIRMVEVAQLPGSFECNETVVQWSSTGTHRDPVYRVCKQIGPGSNMGMRVTGGGATVTGPPLQ